MSDLVTARVQVLAEGVALLEAADYLEVPTKIPSYSRGPEDELGSPVAERLGGASGWKTGVVYIRDPGARLDPTKLRDEVRASLDDYFGMMSAEASDGEDSIEGDAWSMMERQGVVSVTQVQGKTAAGWKVTLTPPMEALYATARKKSIDYWREVVKKTPKRTPMGWKTAMASASYQESLEEATRRHLPLQLKRCVLAVVQGGKPKDAAYAICTASLQQKGYLKAGTNRPTSKGKGASSRKGKDADAGEKLAAYEKLLKGATEARVAGQSEQEHRYALTFELPLERTKDELGAKGMAQLARPFWDALDKAHQTVKLGGDGKSSTKSVLVVQPRGAEGPAALEVVVTATIKDGALEPVVGVYLSALGRARRKLWEKDKGLFADPNAEIGVSDERLD